MTLTKSNQKEFPFKIDPRLKHKLDLLAKTLKKRDVWILVDGDEGTGKTNTASYLLYYFHCITGREFTLDRFYFDSDALFQWAKSNECGLVCWDEAALGGLSAEWYNKSQINLLKFAMTGRKKHHVFVLCIPRFEKLKIDLRKDRIHALIHMDVGKRGDKYGHFVYLTRKGIMHLNKFWDRKKVKPYAYCAKKYGGFFCNIQIPYVFNQLVDEPKYEAMKDKAIENIGTGKDSKEKEEVTFLKYNYASLCKKNENIGIVNGAKHIGKSERTLQRWLKLTPPMIIDNRQAT